MYTNNLGYIPEWTKRTKTNNGITFCYENRVPIFLFEKPLFNFNFWLCTSLKYGPKIIYNSIIIDIEYKLLKSIWLLQSSYVLYVMLYKWFDKERRQNQCPVKRFQPMLYLRQPKFLFTQFIILQCQQSGTTFEFFVNVDGKRSSAIYRLILKRIGILHQQVSRPLRKKKKVSDIFFEQLPAELFYPCRHSPCLTLCVEHEHINCIVILRIFHWILSSSLNWTSLAITEDT